MIMIMAALDTHSFKFEAIDINYNISIRGIEIRVIFRMKIYWDGRKTLKQESGLIVLDILTYREHVIMCLLYPVG